ncbi:unnamed protein product, partial [Adineta steineri]
LKEHGYGGVIIWSLDLDDKTGTVCNEGPFPIFNAAKRELLILPDHLINKDRKCSDDNLTITIEHLHSKMTKIKQNFFLSFLPGVIKFIYLNSNKKFCNFLDETNK